MLKWAMSMLSTTIMECSQLSTIQLSWYHLLEMGILPHMQQQQLQCKIEVESWYVYFKYLKVLKNIF